MKERERTFLGIIDNPSHEGYQITTSIYKPVTIKLSKSISKQVGASLLACFLHGKKFWLEFDDCMHHFSSRKSKLYLEFDICHSSAYAYIKFQLKISAAASDSALTESKMLRPPTSRVPIKNRQARGSHPEETNQVCLFSNPSIFGVLIPFFKKYHRF